MKVERGRRTEFTWSVGLIIDVDAILLDLPADPMRALIEVGRRIRQDPSTKNETTSIRIAIRIIEEWGLKNEIKMTTFSHPCYKVAYRGRSTQSS